VFSEALKSLVWSFQMPLKGFLRFTVSCQCSCSRVV